ncbi:MAG: hypothetical protein ACI9SY_000213 [Candidatus Paceibacteria bacterium]|jgi:hypothetical protein
MQTLLKLEYIALFLLSLVIFQQLEYVWWIYPLFFLAPDLGMLGYLINNKIGAYTYNAFHHVGIAVIFLIYGIMMTNPLFTLVGAILLGHSSFDRIIGYGLKYTDTFKHTHIENL